MKYSSVVPRVLYSDRDSAKMKRKRLRVLSHEIALTLIVWSAFFVLFLIALRETPADPLSIFKATGGLALLLVFAGELYTLAVRGPRDALRHGYYVTDEVLYLGRSTTPISQILRAELVRLAGFGECVAIDHEKARLIRRRVKTLIVQRNETESLEDLQNAIRTALGVPPESSVRETTWREWRRAAIALPRRPTQ